MTKTELVDQIEQQLGENVWGNKKTHVQIQRVTNAFKQKIQQEQQNQNEE